MDLRGPRKNLWLKWDHYGSCERYDEFFDEIRNLNVRNRLVKVELLRIFEKCGAGHKVVLLVVIMSINAMN